MADGNYPERKQVRWSGRSGDETGNVALPMAVPPLLIMSPRWSNLQGSGTESIDSPLLRIDAIGASAGRAVVAFSRLIFDIDLGRRRAKWSCGATEESAGAFYSCVLAVLEMTPATKTSMP